MKLDIIGVNAFCGERAQGNLAGVYLSESPLGEELMQKSAKEFGASETAFIFREATEFKLRWFTPTQEVDLCGHATLAAAYTLWSKGLCKDQQISFMTKSGKLLCECKADEKIEMKFPELKVEEFNVSVEELEALGLGDVLFVGISENYLFVEIENEAELRSACLNMSVLKSSSYGGLLLTSRSEAGPYDFVSRCFFPQEGIPEDPVTGSAHCVLGPYWRKKLKKETLFAYQASEAGGELGISFSKDKVHLTGRARFSSP